MQKQTNINNLKKDIQKILTSLRKKPLTENFWQNELRALRDKYDYYDNNIYNILQNFDNAISSCDDPSYL